MSSCLWWNFDGVFPWSNREFRKPLSNVMLCPINGISWRMFLLMKVFIWLQAFFGGTAIWLCCIRLILFIDIASFVVL